MGDDSKTRNQLTRMKKQLKDMTAQEFAEVFGDFWPMAPGPNEDEFKRWVKIRAGVSFDFMAAKAATLHYSKIYFVDRENGDDGMTGEDWDHPKKTIHNVNDAITDAYAQTRGRNFLCVFQGRLTTGLAHTEEQVIDIDGGFHLKGMGSFLGLGARNSCFVMGDPTAYTHKAGIWVDTNDFKCEGIQFYNPTEYGPNTENYYVYLEDRQAWRIENCLFQGANADGVVTGKQTCGVSVAGAENWGIANCKFYYLKYGVKLNSGPIRWCHKGHAKENDMFGCGDGFYFVNADITENTFSFNRIGQKSTYGFTFVSGFNLAGNPSGNFFVDNRVGHPTKTTAYIKGSGTNYWILNWYASTGGGGMYDAT